MTTSNRSRWRPVILWAAAILVMTSWPSPGGIPDVTGIDKVAHFGVYAVLGTLVARALLPARTRSVLVFAFIGIATFGALDELHQNWIPGRDASVADWIADFSGALVGLAVAPTLLRLTLTRQDQPS
jgi:VanZ family protein